MINENILGCFVSCPASIYNPNVSEKDALIEQESNSELCKLFRSYISGERGISNILKTLKNKDYGKDLVLALFQFYLNPIPYELEHLKEIENYRKNEKAIGIPIIVNDENFFSKSESERYDFLRETILQKLDLLTEVVKKKKLDTNMELLKSDLKNILKAI